MQNLEATPHRFADWLEMRRSENGDNSSLQPLEAGPYQGGGSDQFCPLECYLIARDDRLEARISNSQAHPRWAEQFVDAFDAEYTSSEGTPAIALGIIDGIIG